MQLSREYFDAGLLFVAVLGLTSAIAVASSSPAVAASRPHVADRFATLLAALALPALIAWKLTGAGWGVAAAAFAALIVLIDLRLHVPRLSVVGLLETALAPLALIIGTAWAIALAAGHGASPWLLAAIGASAIVALPFAGLALLGALARNALVTHTRFVRPHTALPARRSGPKVSIQLPCYAEPPEIVIATLDRLAAQDYADFEILVIDNNTRDETLWRPLEAHCARLARRLGPDRVRFFHVAPLGGAKAGALNWVARHQASDAGLIAVIDADYHAEPDFLSRLVGHFDDPSVGYLQTPHDYRLWQRDRYLRACYWEYMPSNKAELPGIAEYGAGYTIGTMCLIRAEAMRAAGGWAEWCLTEDSEVSVRLRALGYQGLYVRDTFGRGLIPDTFEDYRKQRFRWTAGPVQQLRRYWRLYLPRGIARPSGLNDWSRLLELERGLSPLAGALLPPLGLAIAVATTLATAAAALPPVMFGDAAWIALWLGLAATVVRRWHRYRLSGCTRIAGMIEGELAKASLAWVQMVAAIAGLSPHPIAWTRTPKFGATGNAARAFAVTLPESIAGLILLGLGGWHWSVAQASGSDLPRLAALACLLLGLRFLAAPLMAWISERRLAADTVLAPPKQVLREADPHNSRS